ncbi:MAG: metallophosphoesterase family protein [Calditrichota bacterium]
MDDMEVGIISDTHDKLPDDVFTIFRGVEIILHAGDVGSMEIISRLNQIAPTKAVYGNTDIYTVASVLPSKIKLEIGGLNFLLLHNIGSIKSFSWKILRGDYLPIPDVVVFGHTHTPVFNKYSNILFINPGSAGLPRGEYPASVMKIQVTNGEIIQNRLIQF